MGGRVGEAVRLKGRHKREKWCQAAGKAGPFSRDRERKNAEKIFFKKIDLSAFFFVFIYEGVNLIMSKKQERRRNNFISVKY